MLNKIIIISFELTRAMDLDSPLRSHELSPEPEEHPTHPSQESFDILISKHLIPPPLMLLPKPENHRPRCLMPMLPLPAFVGLIPNFQPLDRPLSGKSRDEEYGWKWIGQAFDNIVYRKYGQESYKRIDNVDQNWNIWACDLSKMLNRKSAEREADHEPITTFYIPKSSADTTLVFQSRFECGNLSLASLNSFNPGEPPCYNLLLQNDINTNGYSQWFFFKVSNTRKGLTVKFDILNQYKSNNLYKMGMKIVVYSKRESEEKNISWHRAGDNIQYYENGYSKSTSEYKPFYTLSWEYTFSHDYDEVYFASTYPYTYSNLQAFLFKMESDVSLRQICQRSSLCTTLAGNRVDILTITENHPFQELDKGYIIITSRIHPGESISSYVCNGILEFLLSGDDKARKLRQNFIFKIVPMLNPDGVIHGNNRSNISGYDLNKKWENPSKHYQPEIYYLKKMITGIQEFSDILLFCDLHGHSTKKNAFVYGCHDSGNPRSGKEFPLLVSRLFKGFSFKDCSFLKKQEMEGTSRTFLSKELKHCDIFALQSSFCGPQYEDIHFTVKHFEELGEKFCEALLIYFKDKIKQMQVDAAMKQKSYFHHDDSFDSLPGYSELCDFQQLDSTVFKARVNSQNSQGSEQQNQIENILQEKTIKKYLVARYQRPSTSRKNILIRKSQSKDLGKIRLSQYVSKSNSPMKKRQLYEQPKVEKPKITLKFAGEKKEIHPKVFEPIDIMLPSDRKLPHHTRSVSNKVSLGTFDPPLKQDSHQTVAVSKSNVKIILNKNYEFKQEEESAEPVFKNNFLKALPREQYKSQRRNSDFIIKKKQVQFSQDRNSVNLFNSVLSSLRKDRK